MRIPVKFYVPILSVLLIVGVAATILHWRLAADKSRTVEFCAAMIGGFTALYGLLLSVQQRRATGAARFMERWNRPDFAPYRKAIRETMDAKSPDVVDPDLTRFVLSFWEEVSIAVLSKEADERLLKEFFYSPVLSYFLATQHFIGERRKTTGQPTAYIEYEKLYTRWCPKGT